jgi:hypothetical protein
MAALSAGSIRRIPQRESERICRAEAGVTRRWKREYAMERGERARPESREKHALGLGIR